jgi:O-antigen/teichoic acid export membrane protein
MSLESLLRIGFTATFIWLIGAGGSSVALGVSIAAIVVGGLSYISIRQHIALKYLAVKNSSRKSRNFVPLLVASLVPLLVLNLGPFVVQFLAGAEAATAGIFLNALTLSRIPIMLGPVLQARLIPSVTSILSREEFPTLRKLIGKGMWELIIGGLTFVIGFALFGDIVINTLFGGKTNLNHLDLALLAIPTFLYLLAIAFQSVLVALKETKTIAKAWVLGLFAYLFSLLIPITAILKVEVAGVIAMSTVVTLLFYQLLRAMKSGLASNTIKAE